MKIITTLVFLTISFLTIGQPKNNFENEIIIIETKESLIEQLKQFENQAIYLDIWSVYCGPCIKQFEYKDSLNKFLESKGIVSLYLCVSPEYAIETWKNLINEHNLKGYHIFVSTRIIRDYKIGFNIEGEENYMRLGHNFPYFVIISKGSVKIKKLEYLPSEKEKLIEEISIFLN